MMDKNKFEKIDNCYFCHSGNIISLFWVRNWLGDINEKFHLTKCINCGLVFQNPRVKEEFISSYYTDDLGYYSPSINKKHNFFEKIKLFFNKEVLVNHFGYENIGEKNFFLKFIFLPFKRKYKINLTPDFVRDGKLLDIGCSYGVFIRRMRDLGWNVSGSEMNKKSVDYAKTLGLDVCQSRIEDLTYPANSFDVITMSMVLEHLYNPFDILKKIRNWLKPGGQLIFSIPFFEGVEYKIFKEYSYGLQLPHHINFFNKNIIEKSLKDLGYQDVEFYFQFFDRDIVASAGYKYSETKKYCYKLLNKNKIIRYFLIRPLLYFFSLFGQTGRVTVFAKNSKK